MNNTQGSIDPSVCKYQNEQNVFNQDVASVCRTSSFEITAKHNETNTTNYYKIFTVARLVQ